MRRTAIKSAAALVAAVVALASAAVSASRPAVADSAGWVVPGVKIEPIDSGELDVAGLGAYAGAIEMQPAGGGVAVVNRVALDDYLRGIAEVPSDWPDAALQAQAIAARTYALRELLLGHVLCATDACQVYAGLAKARADTGGWAAAVAATRDQVLLWKGAPILAMYSSSNGGQMVPGSQPYLRGGPDPDDAVAPIHLWHSTVPLSALQPAFATPGPVTGVGRTDHDTVALTWSTAAPAAGEPASGPASGPAPAPNGQAAPAASRSSSASATSAAYASASEPDPSAPSALPTPEPSTTSTTTPPTPSTTEPPAPSSTSTSTPPPGPPSTTTTTSMPPPSSSPPPPANTGVQEVATTAFVQTMNSTQPPPDGLPRVLPSSRFDVRVDSTAGSVVFDGRGFGHGIGMSQFGALGKARRGLRAADILAAYYGGIRPTAAPPGMIPPAIPVTLDESRTTAVVSSPGRFRVTSSDGAVLAFAASGAWQITPAPGGQVRVVPPADQQGPLRIVPVGAHVAGDPTTGGTVEVTLSLSLPAFVRASLVPVAPPTTVSVPVSEAPSSPGPTTPPAQSAASAASGPPAPSGTTAPPTPATAPSPTVSPAAPSPPAAASAPPLPPTAAVATPAPTGPGNTVMALPMGAAAPGTTWVVHLEADAGGGRVAAVDVPLDAIPAAAIAGVPVAPRRRGDHRTGGTLSVADPRPRPLLLLAVATLALLGLGGALLTSRFQGLVAKAQALAGRRTD